MLPRRHFLSGLSALASGSDLLRAAPATVLSSDRGVSFLSDGVPLPPVEYARLLARITEEHKVVPDSYSRDGIVTALEQRFASLLGKECAVFLPTGTLANHLAARIQANGGKVLVQHESHFYNDEGDCAQHLSGLNLVPLARAKAAFTLAEVEEVVERTASGRVAAPVGLISIESPVRRKNGEVFPIEDLTQICSFARGKGIRLHLDGARMFLASPYSGVTVAQYAALFDTVYVSLYKYFNASFGAILAGPRNLLEDLYHIRRMFGGGLPHVWPQGAVALHYLQGFEARFKKAVESSELFLAALARHPGFAVQRILPGSNIAVLSLPATAPELYQARLQSSGIAIALPKQNGERMDVLLTTNETITRRSPGELSQAFVSAAA